MQFMTLRIAAIAFILICTSVAWFWGSPQEQGPPSASFERTELEKVQTETDGRITTRTVSHNSAVQLSLESSRIDAGLKLDYRQKGLLWYSTYVVDFQGAYAF